MNNVQKNMDMIIVSAPTPKSNEEANDRDKINKKNNKI